MTTTQPLRFIRRGQTVTLGNVPPTRTLLEVLREDLHGSGTKEGCGEGDCGACTVVLGAEEDGRLTYRAVNSCIRLAHSVDGMAVWTVEDLSDTDGTLHPAQEAMVQCHGSQCGFCTPGFVMSLFGMYQNHVAKGEAIDRKLAQEELSGNLCRCTGYRPILDAAQHMATLPAATVDEPSLLRKLQHLAQSTPAPEADSSYISPETLAALCEARAAHPEAQIVAGCTDVGLWITKMHMEFERVLDVTRAAELRRIEDGPTHLSFGAAVPLQDAYAALVADRPQLKSFAARFAGLPVRNSGTLGGNVANGSPIGDSMPLLIALGATVVLASIRGTRELPLEALYTGYRKNVMAADELLAFIRVPKAPSPAVELMKVYKISKRFDDDISAVCLALRLVLDGALVRSASIGVGGVAATPVRAVRTEAALTGQPWTVDTVRDAMAVLRGEFQPISDMRASSDYRREVLGNLLQRFWLESQGWQQVNLESLTLEAL
ncbi:xanthine dehydrogenase small subunit [Rhodoferax koreense]|uniref:Xanthine dehydrogenase small subunit n=1 Tax=Rhodoferax koreensis TaxID=1842727 RepID=A0A1P8JY71_9BURK|nr:xanthine dehydrogenase small subunit [Rhodoferax koreense]APW38709.1 xanthine dehydrogenase small subunit [Rhodoferax koreense]